LSEEYILKAGRVVETKKRGFEASYPGGFGEPSNKNYFESYDKKAKAEGNKGRKARCGEYKSRKEGEIESLVPSGGRGETASHGRARLFADASSGKGKEKKVPHRAVLTRMIHLIQRRASCIKFRSRPARIPASNNMPLEVPKKEECCKERVDKTTDKKWGGRRGRKETGPQGRRTTLP